MAFKNPQSFLFSLVSLLSLFTPSDSVVPWRFRRPPMITVDPVLPGGEWVLLHRSIGISAMHMQLLSNNEVVIFDRTDFGTSNISLPPGRECRFNDEAIGIDCSAHSILYDVVTNNFRPLMVQTNVWCSSGSLNSEGTLVQTGGFNAGDRKIRTFTPCEATQKCDWVELAQNLTVRRWYASNHILPDGRIIVVGGRREYSYEFFPKNSASELYPLKFLFDTRDKFDENNLYPFLNILPDGHLFIFANRRSISYDYINHRVVREFPPIPGEKRNFPSTGSSVLLPLRGRWPEAEVMVCGGAPDNSFFKANNQSTYVAASRTCGRIKLTDPSPKWVMELMPMNRVMPDMILLPSGDVLIINGASNGTAGWEDAVGPVLHPVLYSPRQPDPRRRFTVLRPTTIPRMYHSSAILLPDGRILVGGSNPHVKYNFTAKPYPTELSLEAFHPPYLSPRYSYLRPTIVSVEARGNIVGYGEVFSIVFSMPSHRPDQEVSVALVAPTFSTHSYAMNQRLVYLDVIGGVQQLSVFGYKVDVVSPLTPNIAPPGYYMLFVAHDGIPGVSVWIKVQDY